MLMRLYAGSGLMAVVTPVPSVLPKVAPSILDWPRGVKKKEIAGGIRGVASSEPPRDIRSAVTEPRSDVTRLLSAPLLVRFFLSGERLA